MPLEHLFQDNRCCLIQQNGYVLANYYSTERIRTCKLLFNRTDTYLQTTSHQFGFKPKHGTELRVSAFKELLRFYTKHDSAACRLS